MSAVRRSLSHRVFATMFTVAMVVVAVFSLAGTA